MGRWGKGLLQAVRDTETFSFSVAVGKAGVVIQEYATVVAESNFDKFLKRNAPSEMKLLSRLPENQLAYYGFHGNIEGMISWGIKFGASMLAGQDEEKLKQVEETASEYAKLKFGDLAGSFAMGELETGVLRITALMELSPIEKVRELTRKMTKSFGAIEAEGLGFRQEIEFKPEAETVGRTKIDVMTIKQEFQRDAKIAQMQQKMMQAMYGPDGMTNRFAYLKGLVVQTQGGGKDSMVAALKRLDTTTKSAENKTISPARTQLIPKSNLSILIDLPGIAVEVFKLVAASGEVPIPIDAEGLGALKIKTSFTGFSAACEKQAFRLKTSVPVGQVKGIYQLVQFFQNQMGQHQF